MQWFCFPSILFISLSMFWANIWYNGEPRIQTFYVITSAAAAAEENDNLYEKYDQWITNEPSGNFWATQKTKVNQCVCIMCIFYHLQTFREKQFLLWARDKRIKREMSLFFHSCDVMGKNGSKEKDRFLVLNNVVIS